VNALGRLILGNHLSNSDFLVFSLPRSLVHPDLRPGLPSLGGGREYWVDHPKGSVQTARRERESGFVLLLAL
jgi:hypothetical protein